MKTKPGEIWLADLGLAAKMRPVLVVSREDPDPPRVLCIYVPLTSQNRGSKYEVDLGQLPFLRERSTANVQGIGSIPEARLGRRLGELGPEIMERVKGAIRFGIDL